MTRVAAARLGAVQLVAMDVDGVLTDGGIWYTDRGDELKRFDVRDGQGLVLLRDAGVITAVITRRHSAIVERRARELGIIEVHQDAVDKAAVVQGIMARHGVRAAQACYVGDDVGDLPAMAIVGVLRHARSWRPRRHPRALQPDPLRPPEACLPEVIATADVVTIKIE